MNEHALFSPAQRGTNREGRRRRFLATSMLTAVVFLLPLARTAPAVAAPAERPRLGIGMAPKDASSGVAVHGVEQASPAAASGLKEGDVMLKADGQPLDSLTEFYTQLDAVPAGTDLQVRVKRGGVEHTLFIGTHGCGYDPVVADKLADTVQPLLASVRPPCGTETDDVPVEWVDPVFGDGYTGIIYT